MKYEFIQAHRHEFSITRICQVFGISKSGYYAWVKNPIGKREKENMMILDRIIYYHEKSNRVYGSPKIHQDLHDEGLLCNIKRVERLMRENNIRAKMSKKFKSTTDSKHTYPVADNILNREFSVDKKDRVWLSDITFINTNEGWLYLCIIMDLFSRNIVGWSMDNHMRTDLLIDAFNMAYTKRRPDPGLLFHSDRGVQYASNNFSKLLQTKKFIASMSRKGNCWDNAPAESFFHSLKTEEVNFMVYKTRDEAKRSIFEYIEVFYNRYRRHSSLDYLCPVDYELKKSA